MLLTILAYAMIIVFMYVVMKKKMSPFTALIIVPLVAVIIVILTNSANFTADKSFVEFLGGDKISHNLTAIGPMVLYGINNTAQTGIMLLFAILYFSLMLDAGLFDPITEKMIRFAKDGPISASTVRKALKEGNEQILRELLPSTSLNYFLSPEAQPLIKKIQKADNVIHY